MTKNLKVLVLTSIMMFSVFGINSVKAQECIAIFDNESCCNSKHRAVTPTLPESNAAVTVDVLVVYTPAANEWAAQNGSDINDLIDQSISRSNLVLSNSQTGVTLNLVHKQQVDYEESSSPNTDLNKLKDPQDGLADEAHALRSRYAADLVVMLLGDVSSGVLGAGYIMSNEYGNQKSGFSVVQVKTLMSGYTMIHEIGHNFGCGHHTDTDSQALYSYAHGFKDVTSLGNKFSTVMSYENTGGINFPRIPHFSSPNIEFEGTKAGSADANNAKTIRQTKELVAAYSSEVVATDAFLQNINISQGTLSPAFNAGIYNYTINVDNSVTSIDIEGIKNSPQAQILSGNVTDFQLSEGDNLTEIQIRDGWGNYTKTYKINVIRAEKGTATGVNEIDSDVIKIYPNPVTTELKIDNGKLKIKSVEINDISGKIIMNCPNNNSIDVSNLANGVYLIKIHTDKGIITQKFLKK
ncbi:MAG: M12 family metallo-peptidase [Prevotellaceae bacterium]|jgi:hypothetical protein|nr:M12 family metallo-peptidase [Prevotellaceae bacterium]